METATTETASPTHALVPATADTTSVAARLLDLLPGLVAAVVVAGLGVSDGGYFPKAWGPATLVFLIASAAVLMLHPRPSIGLRALAVPALLGLLSLWTLASSTWGSPTEAVPEAERTLLYLSAALAAGLVARRGTTTGLLIGLWAGGTAVCLYAVSTRLLPEQGILDSIAGYRLSEPVGYWNALGLLAALSMVLALGLAARGTPLLVRLVAAASLVPLALTCYFTFSRGAWLALVAGLVAAILLDPRRLNLGVTLALVGPWPALAVLLASRSGPLTESGEHTLAAATKDGRVVTAVAVGLALFAAGVVAIAAALGPRVQLAPATRRLGSGVLVAGMVGALLVGLIALGGPAAIARSFAADPAADSADLNDRLFDLSGNGRVTQWRVALADASDNRIVGSGAGSYQRYWLENRELPAAVEDAHTLYLEMLAELGPIGLALILAVFGLPLVVALRLRQRPLVPIAAGALVTYLARAGIDWDWEFPVLTLFALGCAGVILAEGVERSTAPGRGRRVVLLAIVVALLPVAAVTTLGNRAEAASAEAFDEREFDVAASEARRAERFAPWSISPLVLLGRAQAGTGNLRAARMTFRSAAAREPEQWRVWYELAAASQGDQRAAALRRARALNPLEPRLDELEEGP